MSVEAVGVSKEHITKTPGVCGGKACIAGTRIRVLDIAYHYRRGMTPQDMVERFKPSVTQADVFAALAYYYDHIPEIEELIRQDVEFDKEGQRNPTPLMLRMQQIKLAEAARAATGPLPVG